MIAAVDGIVVGTQGMGAQDFATMREMGTGSWLGRQYTGPGDRHADAGGDASAGL